MPSCYEHSLKVRQVKDFITTGHFSSTRGRHYSAPEARPTERCPTAWTVWLTGGPQQSHWLFCPFPIKGGISFGVPTRPGPEFVGMTNRTLDPSQTRSALRLASCADYIGKLACLFTLSYHGSAARHRSPSTYDQIVNRKRWRGENTAFALRD